ESVSNGIRQRNGEKKLLHESKSSESIETILPFTSLMSLEESISGERGPATEQRSSITYKERSGKYREDVFDFTVDESDK
ncbi:15525_t:CDS:2, partial [Acaulospora morrowiae]